MQCSHRVWKGQPGGASIGLGTSLCRGWMGIYVGIKNRADQRFGIGMPGLLPQVFTRQHLHNRPQIHDRHLMGQRLHQGNIMADKADGNLLTTSVRDMISCSSSDLYRKRLLPLPSQVSPMAGFHRRGQNLDTYSTAQCWALHPVLFSAFQPACALESTGHICYAFYR